MSAGQHSPHHSLSKRKAGKISSTRCDPVTSDNYDENRETTKMLKIEILMTKERTLSADRREKIGSWEKINIRTLKFLQNSSFRKVPHFCFQKILFRLQAHPHHSATSPSTAAIFLSVPYLISNPTQLLSIEESSSFDSFKLDPLPGQQRGYEESRLANRTAVEQRNWVHHHHHHHLFHARLGLDKWGSVERMSEMGVLVQRISKVRLAILNRIFDASVVHRFRHELSCFVSDEARTLVTDFDMPCIQADISYCLVCDFGVMVAEWW